MSKHNIYTAFIAVLLTSLTLVSCDSSSDPDQPNGTTLSGTVIYDIPSTTGQVATYSFSNKKEALVFTNGVSPSWIQSGDVLCEEQSNTLTNNKWKIVTSSISGTNRNILLDSKMDGKQVMKNPKMSIDGSKICFNYWYSHLGSLELYTGHGTILMNADGTLIGALDSVFDGSWMPDGSLIVSTTVDLQYGQETFLAQGLYRLSADRSEYTAIGSGLLRPKHPAASPDGNKIAFAMGSHIWVINIDGTGLRQVTTGTKIEFRPCWSPDGKYIACVCYGQFEDGFYDAMAAFPADGTTPIDLTNNSPYWVIDPSQTTSTDVGRINPYTSISWK